MNASQDDSGQLRVEWRGGGTTDRYQVLIDDTAGYREPILQKSVNATELVVGPIDAGLAPGVTYYVKVVSGDGQSVAETTIRLKTVSWTESELSYDYARAAWETSGREWMKANSGVAWDEGLRTWTVVEPWADEFTNVAVDAYATEYAALGAVNMAAVRHDVALLDEMAAFYVAYEKRFTTLGAMKGMTQYNTSKLSGPDATRTLLSVWNDGTTTYVQECDLCNSQFYYPAARLLRIITTLPAQEVTPAMRSFADWYAPVMARDHALRLLYRNNGQWLSWIENGPGGLTDTALWVAAQAAELLGANANAAELVGLSSTEVVQLQQGVQRIAGTLRTKYVTLSPGTLNFQGTPVGSASYFDGSYVYNDLSSYTYSGYSGEAFPTPNDAAYQPGASWDVAHISRLPVFFRALFDNKKATGRDFPSHAELQLLTNQLVYKAFQGDMQFPLFNNFFDGTNGWYRVGYHGERYGVPPAQYCNSYEYEVNGNESKPCLNAGSLQGWGMVAFANGDLGELEHSLARLATGTDEKKAAFRRRYYFYAGQEYAVLDGQGQAAFPIALLFVMGGAAECLQ